MTGETVSGSGVLLRQQSSSGAHVRGAQGQRRWRQGGGIFASREADRQRRRAARHREGEDTITAVPPYRFISCTPGVEMQVPAQVLVPFVGIPITV